MSNYGLMGQYYGDGLLRVEPEAEPQWDRDMLLPFARRSKPAAQQPPQQWGSTADVMRTLDARQGHGWQFAVPGLLKDAYDAAAAVGGSAGGRPFVPSEQPELTENMIGNAGAIVGPMAAHGFARNALAPAGGAELGAAGGKGIRAYHGSPHDFDRFDMSKIGTGEGAQAFGHGLYFAENEGVARGYRNRLSKEAGRLYEVKINADPEHFLDWDKPLSQQSEKVRGAFEKAVPDRYKGITADEEVLAGDHYRNIFHENDNRVYKTLFRRLMKDEGIPGIKYLDQGSRDAGDGSRNYVVFDDALVQIVRKYMAAGMSMGAAVAAAQSQIGNQPGAGPLMGQPDQSRDLMQ